MTQNKKRIVFMGTPDFAAAVLEILLESSENYAICAVYSRPDAVSKRGKMATPSPVSQLALERELPLYRPVSLRGTEVQKELAELKPDLIIVAAYGMILPLEVLNIPPRGCVNIHASLLPRWRGAAPIERAILAGDVRTGVSIMQMEEGLDTGPYCAFEFTEIAQKSAPELRAELAEKGGHLLVDLMPALLAGSVQWTTQNEDEVTHAAKIEKSEMKLSSDLKVFDFARRVRASSESAPARLQVEGRGVTILEAIPVSCSINSGLSKGLSTQSSYLIDCQIQSSAIAERAENPSPKPELLIPSLASGTVQLVKHQGKRQVLLGCADGTIELLQLKPDGKKAMSAADWLNGFPDASRGLTWD